MSKGSKLKDKAKRGKKVSGHLTIAESADRQEIRLNYFAVWGTKEGPTLLINAAVHGNEVVGVEVLREMVDYIDPKKLSGNVLAVPIVNPMAFNSGLRWDPYDNVDMNRVFPGNPDGTMTERIAHSFFDIFVKEANYIIDLHSAEFPDELIPHIRVRVENPSREYLDLVVSTGINAVWNGPTLKGMLQTEAFRIGVPCTTIEIGAAGKITRNNVDVGTTAVKNVMYVLGMLEGTAEIPSHQIVLASNRPWVRSPIGGIFKPAINLGQFVKRGENIGDIIDPTSFENHDLTSPLSGVVTGLTNQPIVRSGTRVTMVIDFDRDDMKKHLVESPALPNSKSKENEYLIALMKELN
ncbi:MAG: succinylglutamate desuccinylase/aspartoacylase family protein [Deltaproteobacteria bacterium]|uniref:Succinylglutamate desuccinylase/aspartoacylase family protein n=1 Tax=Candidatus Zymogenus saltonus TaxID=2844893 RepID=A0A9D8KGU2_9DELT|nr:succinylglutamate desuccinylase/aspartoacylase family protein [Candidatus Zymogenus saltonus]